MTFIFVKLSERFIGLIEKLCVCGENTKKHNELDTKYFIV